MSAPLEELLRVLESQDMCQVWFVHLLPKQGEGMAWGSSFRLARSQESGASAAVAGRPAAAGDTAASFRIHGRLIPGTEECQVVTQTLLLPVKISKSGRQAARGPSYMKASSKALGDPGMLRGLPGDGERGGFRRRGTPMIHFFLITQPHGLNHRAQHSRKRENAFRQK